MHRTALLLSLLLFAATTFAAPVDQKTAQTAGTQFLLSKGLIKSNARLTPCKGISDESPAFYIFNLDSTGFVIVSADDRCTPILGYSMNGSFDYSLAPDNMKAWLSEWSELIHKGILTNAPENSTYKKLWYELTHSNPASPSSTKSDQFLLTSTWEQGRGYNNYCPVMNGQHVVVGCVATAMAQIIRYHEAPTRGFGKKSYPHTAYGILSVDFDTSEYDYSLMPDRITNRSSASERDMVSRLCYHCGVVVNMEYQHADHTSGSGAHTRNVPEGLRHFGYTSAIHYTRTTVNNDSLWVAMIRTEIDELRPIEYSGFSNEGGHAFVLDGYNDNNQYHFNWGWGGYCDGFYTLSNMMGFNTSHEMVVNIKPSGWDGHLTQFHVAPDGDGNGTSWSEANSDLNSAIILSKYCDRQIWMKEGLYHGDTASEYAFTLTNECTIYGGFAGTETSINQRNTKEHPTILDGQRRHKILNAHCSLVGNRLLSIYDITMQNGYCDQGTVVNISGDIMAKNIILRNCTSDSGSILQLSDYARMLATIIHSNEAPTLCRLNEGIIRQSLIQHNNADAMELNSGGRVVNCDIVSNQGHGVIFRHPKCSFINNIVWNNGENIRFDTLLPDTSFRHCAVEGQYTLPDSLSLLLASVNEDPQGPRFSQPGTQRGIAGYDEAINWRLMRGSVCIDAGERLSESVRDGDLDQSLRSRNGHIDIGCYESNYPVGIDPVAPTTSLYVYPNPASSTISVTNCGEEVRIFDIIGHEVLHSACTAEKNATIDIRHLPKGVYFLKSGARTVKFVKR